MTCAAVTLTMLFISVCILAPSSPDSDWRFWVLSAVLLAFYYAYNRNANRRQGALAKLVPSMKFPWSDTLHEIPAGIAQVWTASFATMRMGARGVNGAGFLPLRV